MKSKETIYAKDVGHYFRTSKSHYDTWMNRTKAHIAKIGGHIISEMVGTIDGKSGVILEFETSEGRFRLEWPILPTREVKDETAAKVQAATALNHQVKSMCVAAKFRGIRAAFHGYLLLPDGRIASQLSAPELIEQIPAGYLSQGD